MAMATASIGQKLTMMQPRPNGDIMPPFGSINTEVLHKRMRARCDEFADREAVGSVKLERCGASHQPIVSGETKPRRREQRSGQSQVSLAIRNARKHQ